MRDRQQRRSTINRGLFAVSVLSSAGGLALTAYAQQPKQGQMLILAACSGREQTAVAPHATEGCGSSSPPRVSSAERTERLRPLRAPHKFGPSKQSPITGTKELWQCIAGA